MGKDTSLTAPTKMRTARAEPSLGAEAEVAEHDRIARGESVGRYIVLGELARGGMGIVYRAHDPELDRLVALKLVRFGGARSHDASEARARLLREARSLAKLSHPNVVQVHDVGRHGVDVFIAMELVDGTDLGKWLGERETRRWGDVLPLFIQAARGLSAAHAVGLVHRDFKPGNVLVARDGVVKVVDFGLAKPAAAVDDDEPSPSPSGSPTGGDVTRAGVVLGTPRYMAPEQQGEHEVDARSDQYSFCVALFEALAGRHPFADDASREADPSDAPLRASGAPARVREAVLRGLARDPAQRFASMDDLLRVIDRRPVITRWTLAVGVLAAGGAAAGFLATRSGPTCTGGAEQFAQTWNTDRAQALGTTFEASGSSHGAATWDLCRQRLDEIAARWVETWEEACRATHHRGDASPERLDARMHCLERDRARIDALLRVFAEADATAVRSAVEAVDAAPRGTGCLDAVPGAVDVGTPGVAEAERSLADASALLWSARFEDAFAAAAEAKADAQRVARRDLESEALLVQGRARRRLGAYPEALELLREALFSAETAAADAVRVDVLVELAELVGYLQNRADEGTAYARQALSVNERLGSPPRSRAQALAAWGLIDGGAARHTAAQQHLQQALSVIDEAGLELPRTSVLTRLGYIQTLAGEFEVALATLDANIEATYRTFGPRHPRTGLAHNLRGHTLLAQGRPREALTDLTTARGILEADASPLKPDLADVLTNLASVHLALHEPAEALQLFRDAQALYVANGGPTAVRVGSVLNDISDALLELGRADEALAAAREAQAIFAEHYGPDHPQMAQAIESAGAALHVRGELREALEHFERGKQIRASTLGDDHVDLAYSFERIGRVLIDLDRPADAVEALQTAVALWRRALPIGHPRIAQTEFELARALWADPTSQPRALELARAASVVLEQDERADPRVRDAARAWLKNPR